VASVGLESALGLIGCKGRGVFLLSGRAHSDKWARVNWVYLSYHALGLLYQL